MPDQPTVAVVGAGVGGLTAAWRLARLGFVPLLLEASHSLGGAIHTQREEDGWRPELGPNTIPDKNCVVSQLIDELGIAHQLLPPDLSARRRFIVRDGQLHALPSSLKAFVQTPIWSPAAKLRLLAEPFIPRREDDGVDESLANFVRRRLGPEMVDYAIDPFIAGTYAGKPQHLSALHTVRRVVDLERRAGSIMVGALRAGLSRALSVDPPPPKPLDLVNFEDGVQTLTDALADALPAASIRTGCAVRAITQRERGWTITYADGEGTHRQDVDGVILALPAWVIGKLDIRDASGAPLDASFLASITHPPAQMLSLGFKREDVGHPLDGFGMLIPEVEGKKILGAVFNSTIFPRRAPPGHVLMTVFLGGARAPHLGELSQEDALAVAMPDLRALLKLKVRGEPVRVWRRQWSLAIPQPEVGWGDVLDQVARFEASAPGLRLTGNWRGGISVADTIAQGRSAADHLASHLRAQRRAAPPRPL
jgi:protoporphyrinogen/coproporphyrinogen III oxidase